MTLAVVTIAHRRHDHLRGQVVGLAAGTARPDLHVVAVMDDPDLPGVARRAWEEVAGEGSPVRMVAVPVPSDPRGLPLALARNLGAAAARERGADDLVFLDVDCIPGPSTVAAYGRALGRSSGLEAPGARGPRLLQGDVGYLPPLPEGWSGWGADPARLEEGAEHRADRVRLPAEAVRPEPDLTRFWSLSFAMTATDLERTGGFCTDYVGYGGEDTDFAQRVGAAGGELVWVGGATAYHQHHPSVSPPLQHLEAVVRNAGVFYDRWGWWPMLGWLESFAALGLAGRDEHGRWQVLS